jgi:hypothetical protein
VPSSLDIKRELVEAGFACQCGLTDRSWADSNHSELKKIAAKLDLLGVEGMRITISL